MATIAYSMAGEGRGHAARARVVVDALRGRHRLLVYAPDQAHEFLAPIYADKDVEVRRLPGLRFHYRGARLDLTRTLWSGGGYLRRLPRLARDLSDELVRESVDMAITDFEPALPRAARRARIPFVSLDHQHFLVACDLSSLPTKLRWYASYMGAAVRLFHRGAQKTLVSAFFKAPLKPAYRHVVQVGALFREGLFRRPVTAGRHLLAYLRGEASRRAIEVLKRSGRPTIIYGLGERPADGNLHFRPIDEQTFLDDLAGSDAIVCAAGNQLLSEVYYLGKPCLAIPEADHHEQQINAHFLAAAGAGRKVDLERLGDGELGEFLEQRESYRTSRARAEIVGNDRAVAEIEQCLASVAGR